MSLSRRRSLQPCTFAGAGVALERAWAADVPKGLSAGLANKKRAYTIEELSAATRICSKFVKAPTPERL